MLMNDGRDAALLALPEHCAAPDAVRDFVPAEARSRVAGPWRLVERSGSARAAVENFITRRFFEDFSARVATFMPRLLGLCDPGGAVAGAAGLRCAAHRLFVERYLDAPIERVVARHAGQPVARSAIVEVGHLCGAFAGATRVMIGLLAPRLHAEGFAWVVFTGTPRLRNAFARVGMVPVDVAAASAQRLSSAEQARWGRYYDHAPRVMIGRIEDGIAALARAPRSAAFASWNGA